MEKVVLQSKLLDCQIEIYKRQFENLMAAEPLKYSDWPNAETDYLRKSAGIYYFFERKPESSLPLYVGKAGYGGGKWSLYKRLSQHFQVSQQNTILGKMTSSSSCPAKMVKTSLSNTEVYLQWIAICSNPIDASPDLNSELIWIECFFKSILKPRYTDA